MTSNLRAAKRREARRDAKEQPQIQALVDAGVSVDEIVGSTMSLLELRKKHGLR